MSRHLSEFLATFFGPGNRYLLSDVEKGGEGAGRLLPWVERLRGPSPQRTVLPHVRMDGWVDWYGLAFSEAESRMLGEELTAFVGPSFSNFRGLKAELKEDILQQAAVLKLTGGRAFRLQSPKANGAGDIWKCLELLYASWAQMVHRRREEPRPTAAVLRDFHLALRASNRTSAEASLRFLQENYRLDTLNLLFLRVQLLAELGTPTEVLGLPEWESLLQVRRPLAVTSALVASVYRQEIAPYEARSDVKGAVAHFQGTVLPLFGSLYQQRAGATQSEVVKSFMLLAVAQKRLELRDELLGISLPLKERNFLEAIAALVPKSKPAEVINYLEAAQEAAIGGDFDRALVLARQAPATVERIEVLWRCAQQLDSLEAKAELGRAMQNLFPNGVETLLRERRNRSHLEVVVGGPAVAPKAQSVPTNWLEWLERLNEDAAWPHALEVARQGAAEWSVEPLLSGHTAGFVNLMQQVASQESFQDALPHLLASIQRDAAYPRPEFREVYLRLMEALVYGGRGTADAATIFNELAECLLRLGMQAEAYGEMVGLAEDFWRTSASAVLLDGILDFLDLLMAHPCADRERRTSLLGVIVSGLGSFLGRVDDSQWAVLQGLCAEFRMPEILKGMRPVAQHEAAQAAAEPLQFLAGKLVGIYTLTETAGQRLRDALEKMSPTVRVQLSHDHVGNDRLKALAQNADLFVMVTASSKHAATNFIEDHRPKDLPLVRPAGKGSASALRAIFELLQRKRLATAA